MRLLIAMLLLAASAAGAQSDYSGTWVRVVDSTAARATVATAGDAAFRVGDMGNLWGSPLTITQRADSVIFEFPFFGTYDLQPPIRYAFALNGSTSTNTIILSHGSVNTTGTAQITGHPETLSVTMRYPTPAGVPGNGYVEVTRIFSRSSPTTLNLETRFGATGGGQTSYTKR